MSWIKVDDGLSRHPKVIKLARRVGVEPPAAIGWLVCFWSAVALHRPSGRLDGMSKDDIEIMSEWSRDANVWADALIEVGLIDVGDDGAFSVHDWEDHAAFRTAAAARQRRYRDRRRNVTRDGRDVTRDVTRDARDVTRDVTRDARDVVSDVTRNDRYVLEERRGEEKREEERRGEEKRSDARASEVDQVIDHYRSLGHERVRRGSDTARSKIKARLKDGRSVGELCRALDAMHRDQWSRENNQLTLEACFRNDERVVKWLEAADRPQAPKPRQQQRSLVELGEMARPKS